MPALPAVRQLFLARTPPPPLTWVAMFAWPVAATALVYAVLVQLRPEIRDAI